jgi:hypothetical protein
VAEYQEFKVYLVLWLLKFDPEDDRKKIASAKATIKAWCHPAIYGKRAIGFVVVTDESASDLALRLRVANQDSSDMDNIHIILAPESEDIACAFALNFGPLNHWVRAGWVEARQRNAPKHMRHRQRRELFAKVRK